MVIIFGETKRHRCRLHTGKEKNVHHLLITATPTLFFKILLFFSAFYFFPLSPTPPLSLSHELLTSREKQVDRHQVIPAPGLWGPRGLPRVPNSHPPNHCHPHMHEPRAVGVGGAQQTDVASLPKLHRPLSAVSFASGFSLGPFGSVCGEEGPEPARGAVRPRQRRQLRRTRPRSPSLGVGTSNNSTTSFESDPVLTRGVCGVHRSGSGSVACRRPD